jgi:hypothetical protein
MIGNTTMTRHFPVTLIAAGLGLGSLGFGSLGCSSFDAPPQATIVDAAEGLLPDPLAPLALSFHEPVVPESLLVKVIRLETDIEGNLFDEDADEETQLDIFYQHPGPDGLEFPDIGGEGALDPGRRRFTMNLSTTLPIGPQLAVLIEVGLQDDEGNEWKVRQILKFGYEFSCGGEESAMPTEFPSGSHFMVVDVDSPIQTQLQLLAAMKVDPETGAVVGQFTNADRDESIDCSQFGLSCESTEVCRTLPSPACVAPSEGAGTADEYSDYTHNAVPPTGYSFTVLACVRDEPDGSFTFANAPVDVEVQSPPVTVKGINFNGGFRFDSDGILRGDGTFSAPEIFLGTTPSGAGVGTIAMRLIPEDELKPGTPQPPDDPAPPP